MGICTRSLDALSGDAVERAGRLLVGQLDPEQAWFWTREWQAGEREADAQVASGAGAVFGSDEESSRT